MCVNTISKRKNISNRIKEATGAAHQCGAVYKVVSKQSKLHYSIVRKIIHKWKTLKVVANLRRT